METNEFPILNRYIDLYLDKHAEVIEDKNEKGWTALMIAAVNSNSSSTIETVRILLSKGANPNIRIEENESSILHEVLYFFEKETPIEVIKLLVDHGAYLNINDSYDEPPLLNAIEARNIQAIKYMIENGASIFDEDFNAIDEAMYIGDEEILLTIFDFLPSLDIKIGQIKLIKLLYTEGYSDEIILYTLRKGAKIDDIMNGRLKKIWRQFKA